MSDARQSIQQKVFEYRGSYATTLVTLLIDMFGTEEDAFEPLRWAPETLRLEIFRACGARLPDSNLDRIMALASVLTDQAEDSFYRTPSRFIQICNILSGDEFDPSVFEPADVYEIAWGVTEVVLNDPPDRDNPEPFSEEVRYYIGFMLNEEGIINPPDVLQLALRDHDPQAIASEFADDPLMFGAIYSGQEEKTGDIVAALQGALFDLKSQLEALPLENGTVEQLFKNLRQLQTINAKELEELNAP